MNRLKNIGISLAIVIISILFTLSIFEVFIYKLSQIRPIPTFLISLNKNLYFGKWFHIFSERGECYEFSKTRFYDLKKESICHFDNVEYSTIVTVGSRRERLNDFYGINQRGSIIAIGDSVTMGWGVNDNETYSSILQGLLHVNVINLGVPSYNTSRELDKLTNFLRTEDVKTIIIQYHTNDHIENISYLKNGPKNYSIQDYNGRQGSFDKVYGWHTGGYYFFDYTIKIFELFYKNRFGDPRKIEMPRDLDHEAEVFFSILKKYPYVSSKNIIIFDGSELDLQNNDFKHIFSKVAASFGLENVKVLDMEFSSHDYFALDNHQNMLGHKKIAENINKVIIGSK